MTRRTSGRGKVYSFVVKYRPGATEGRPEDMEVIAVVQMDEGPRVMGRLVGVPSGSGGVHCDMPVEMVLDEFAGDDGLPSFRAAAC